MTIKDSEHFKEFEARIKEKKDEAVSALRSATSVDVYRQQGFLEALDFVLELPDKLAEEKAEDEKRTEGEIDEE